MDSIATASGDLIRACGGNGLYATVGVHIWDQHVGIVARAGDDYPASCLAEIAAAVDVGGLRRVHGPHPLRVAYSYRPDGSRTRGISTDVLRGLSPDDGVDLRSEVWDTTHLEDRHRAGTPTPEDIPDAWLAGVGAVHLPVIKQRSQQALIQALRAAQADRIITVDSLWYDAPDPAADATAELLRAVDAILPSEIDLARFRPGLPLLEAARQLIGQGARAAVIKLGSAGSIVLDGLRSIAHVPAYPARTVDPTGAGDSFCGGFLVGLKETGDLVRAALYGTVAASFVVEERSAIPVFRVTRAAAEARLASIATQVRLGITIDPRRAEA